MNITIIGHLFFADKLAKILEEKGYIVTTHYHNDIWKKQSFKYYNIIKKSDVIYFFCANGLEKYFRAFVLRFIFKKKLIVHFVGSDALKFLNYNIYKRLRWTLALKISHEVFGISPNIVDELSPYIRIKYLPMSIENYNFLFRPFPKQFTVLVYLPPNNPNFYGLPIIKKLIKNNLKIKFIILGKDYGNISNFNNVEIIEIDKNNNMNKLYERSSVLIRLTKHDGAGQMVMEALARGRHVIWTSKSPYCQHVDRTLDSVQKELELLIKSSHNKKAMKWVKENFSSSILIKKLEKYFKKD